MPLRAHAIFPRYEHRSKPLAPLGVFYRRVINNFLFAFVVIIVWLLIGLVGYHFTAHIAWIDAFHNASMILSGMGPVVEITTTGGKVFSSIYAIFSGVVFITMISFILAPVVHRFFHRMHLQEK